MRPLFEKKGELASRRKVKGEKVQVDVEKVDISLPNLVIIITNFKYLAQCSPIRK